MDIYYNPRNYYTMARIRTRGVDNTTGQDILYNGTTNDTIMGSPSIVTIEINIGTYPVFSGTFDILASNLTIGRTIIVSQACGPYTGKGTLADEAEMDIVNTVGYIFDDSTIRCYWNSATLVGGNIKFSYQVIIST